MHTPDRGSTHNSTGYFSHTERLGVLSPPQKRIQAARSRLREACLAFFSACHSVTGTFSLPRVHSSRRLVFVLRFSDSLFQIRRLKTTSLRSKSSCCRLSPPPSPGRVPCGFASALSAAFVFAFLFLSSSLSLSRSSFSQTLPGLCLRSTSPSTACIKLRPPRHLTSVAFSFAFSICKRSEPQARYPSRPCGHPPDAGDTRERRRRISSETKKTNEMTAAQVASQGGVKYCCLKTLNPYVVRWCLKVRVVERTDLMSTKNARQFFTADLKDASGEVIRAVFWGDAAEHWSPVLKQGKVYQMSKGRVQVANKRFNTVGHQYELVFYRDSEITEVADEGDISTARKLKALMSLRDIAESKRELPFFADVLVVVVESQPVTSVVSKKTGEEFKRRNVKVVDRSQYEMEISLWGNQVDALEGVSLPRVVAFTGLQVREWQGGRQASTGKGSEILTSLQSFAGADKDSQSLLQWYKENSGSVRFASMSRGGMGEMGGAGALEKRRVEEKCVDEIKQMTDGAFSFIGQIRRVYWRARRRDTGEDRDRQMGTSGADAQQAVIMYPACSSCRKKLVENGEGDYTCYACDKPHAQADWRYMLMVNFVDHTSNITIRCFADQAEELLGVPANELQTWSLKEKEKLLDCLLPLDVYFRVVIRARVEMYNGEERVQRTAIKIEKLSPAETARRLVALTKELLSQASPSVKDEVSRKRPDSLMSGEEADRDENTAPNVFL
ncbi:OB-fold nucleic acid binding domain-containing protein [Toxoplasma gondii CAST]|uniref:OB-fold nucleic acid binding domain-containing protein n=1 Tax=Toxoplasma gondii CAST TaxID=943122 RepID=A0A3R8ASP6_TOXGO|nr:OB-fold nucleic acid binding domain-containing protein [Toxoplasma gondii CAST]